MRSHVRLAERHPWLVRVVLGACTAALLAETAPPTYDYSFELKPQSAMVELTQDAPTHVFRITLQANALGPDRVASTNGASMRVTAAIEPQGFAEGARVPFVSFDAYEADSTTPHEPLSALTDVGRSLPLQFAGDCTNFTETPCVATVFVELSRTDDGAEAGSFTVSWQFSASASTKKEKSPSVGPIEMPWTVTVEEL